MTLSNARLQVGAAHERDAHVPPPVLDTGQFEAWLKLFEPHGIYWIPSKPGQTDPLNVASSIYEDHAILQSAFSGFWRRVRLS
jgi:hypothetical protein